MKNDASKSQFNPNQRELSILEMLRENPRLLAHVEEFSAMTRDEKVLLSNGHDAESKVVGLCKSIGKAGLQGWADAANKHCEETTSRNRPKGQNRHLKKTPLAEPFRGYGGRGGRLAARRQDSAPFFSPARNQMPLRVGTRS